MRQRRTSRLFVVACAAAALLVSATAAAVGPAGRTVKVSSAIGGPVVAYGRSQALLVNPAHSSDPGLTRINLNGSIDRSFGEEGTVEIAGNDAVVLSGGKILVSTSGNGNARVTRLLPDGRRDRSFGVAGSANVDFGGRYDAGQALALAPSGEILLAGVRQGASVGRGESSATPAVARLRPDGSLDRSFARKGIRLIAGGGEVAALDLAPTPNGGIVVQTGNEIQTDLWKLTRDGAVDRRFGKGGWLEVRGEREKYGYHEELFMVPQLAVLPNGKLLLAATGFPNRGPNSRFGVVAVRLRPDGRTDRSYGDDGWARVSAARGHASAEGLALLPGGVLVIATTFNRSAKERRDFAAIAFGPNGHPDRRFGKDGRCRAELPGEHSASAIAAFGRRVVVAGWGEGDELLLKCPPLRRR